MSAEETITELTKVATVFALACSVGADKTAARLRSDAHDLLDVALDQLRREAPKMPKDEPQ